MGSEGDKVDSSLANAATQAGGSGEAFDETVASTDPVAATLSYSESEVGKTGAPQDDAGAYDQTLASDAPRQDDRVGAGRLELRVVQRDDYSVGGELARGGMGRVLAAKDRRHGRRVALKEMLRESPAMAARFQREALITAQLQHPSIVPVYEAGTWPDGSLFFSMKLVEGTPLRELLGKNVALVNRLALLPKLIAVCEAIAYAHKEGVIHRDLKPSNVIVGEFGETVVIDWGLAKRVGEDDDELDGELAGVESDGLTVAGAVVGTPAYMCPEQATGERVDTRSDVYALGAMLYHVLGGVAPHRGASVDEVLDKVKTDAPPSLSELAPSLPRDLIAIVDKAMARSPANRYEDARELAEELRLFQTGKLVGAHSYTTMQLVRRFIQRNTAAVAVATVLILVLAVVGSFSIYSVMQERDEADRQRKKAQKEHSAALTQRSAAERLVDYMLTDLHGRLQRNNKVSVLEGVTKKVDEYYRTSPSSTDAATFERKARLANIHADLLLIKGEVKAAAAANRRALAFRRRLLAQAPQNKKYIRLVARALVHLAWTLRSLGAYDEAKGHAQAAVAMVRPIFEGHAKDPIAAGVLSRAYSALGHIYVVGKQHDKAREVHAAAKKLAKRAWRSQPKSREYLKAYAVATVQLGTSLDMAGKHQEALVHYNEILGLTRKVLRLNPNDLEALSGLGRTQMKIGNAYAAMKKWKESLAAHTAGRDAMERVMKADPDNSQAKIIGAVEYANMGDVMWRMGDKAKGLGHIRKAIALRESVMKKHPGNTEWMLDLASSYVGSARLIAHGAKVGAAARAEARGLLNKALAILEALDKAGKIPKFFAPILSAARKARAALD